MNILERQDKKTILLALIEQPHLVSFIEETWVCELEEAGLFSQVEGVTASGRDFLTVSKDNY